MRDIYFPIKIWLSLLLIALQGYATAQSSCFALKVGTVAANPGDTVRLPVSVMDFTDMVVFQFPFVWNPADLQFIRADVSGSPLDFLNFGATAAGEGRLRNTWYDFNVEGVSLPENAVIYTLEFKVLANAPGFYPVSVTPQIPGFGFEILRSDDQPLPLLHTAGGVQVGAVAGPPLELTRFCANSGFCNDLQGGLNAEVSGGMPPYEYAWTGPNGFTSTQADPGSLIAGHYVLTVTDQNGQTLVAGATILSLWSGLSVWPDSIGGEWCNQANGCATIRINGGNPPYVLSWPDGPSGVTQRCDLQAGAYAVTVADAAGCSRVVHFAVPGDEQLKIETQTAFADCRSQQPGAAAVTVLNGWTPYAYRWSNGAQTAALDQPLAGKYTVTVTDAAGCKAVAPAEVKDYGTLDWYVHLTAYCTTDSLKGPAYARLNAFDFETRAAYPLTLEWSTGTRDLLPEYLTDSLSSLHRLSNGRYSVTVSDAEGCTVEASDFVDCQLSPPSFSYPNTRFYLHNNAGNGAADSCIDVRVQHFTNMDTVHFTLDWRYMQFKEIKNLATPSFLTGITAANFKTGPTDLEFSWKAPPVNASGLTLGNDARLFTVCFSKTVTSYSVVEFVKGASPPVVRDKSGQEHGFIGKNGRVRFEQGWSGAETVEQFNLSLPNCEQDGFAKIELKPYSYFSYLFLTVTHDNVKYENSDFSRLNFAAPGHYHISLGANNSSSAFYVYIPPYQQGGDACVWPGDADNNNAVNHFDLLYAGLAMEQAGPERIPASTLWTGQSAGDWSFASPIRAVNGKHMDADGNGLVDAADTAAIAENWARVLNIYQNNPFAAPVLPDHSAAGLTLMLQTDTMSVGHPVSLPVLVGLPGNEAENIHGLVFSIGYEPEKLEGGGNIYFEPLPSWLGDPAGGLLCMQRNFPGQRRLDIAVTRTDGQPADGEGPIGRLWFSPAPPDSGEHLPPLAFSITRAAAFTPSEVFIPLNGPAAIVPLRPATTLHSGALSSLDRRVSIWPNPVCGMLNLVSDLPIETAELFDAGGALKRAFTPGHPMPVYELPGGIYWLRIGVREGVIWKKVVVR